MINFLLVNDEFINLVNAFYEIPVKSISNFMEILKIKSWWSTRSRHVKFSKWFKSFCKNSFGSKLTKRGMYAPQADLTMISPHNGSWQKRCKTDEKT